MNIVLSFVGKLPQYIIYCIHQIRCYTNIPIYLIINDTQSQHIEFILKYNVCIIDYNTVIDINFINVSQANINKFLVIHALGDRSELFIRSFERFFLLHNLMKNQDIKDCLFIELDNLIYDNPLNWFTNFSKSELCYMYDNKDRCSAGIMYAKQHSSLTNLLEYMLDFINNSNEFMNEMTCLYRYYENHKNEINLKLLQLNFLRKPKNKFPNHHQ